MKNVRAERKEIQKVDLQKKQQAEEDMKNAYKMVFGSEQGKKVLAHINKVCGYGEDNFNPDPYLNAYGNSRNAIAIHINKVLGG